MIFIDGVTGFVGSSLCKRLLAEGYQVCGLSHYGDIYRIKSVMGNKNFSLEVGDIRDAQFVASLFAKRKFDSVFHLAAQVPYAKEEKDFGGINASGTLNILKAAYANGVDNFIYASSMSVYSPPSYLPVDENHPTVPVDMYGQTKLLGESSCKEFSDSMRVVILRYAGIYGVNSEKDRVVPVFVRCALRNKPLVVDGDGSHSSDFVLINDVIEGILLAWYRGRGVYNIGSGCETSLKDLAKMVISLTSSKSQIIYKPDGTSRPFRFYLDIKKAQRELGYYPHSLKDGLGLYVRAIS
jgi:UDP-glucose 4-epimerase